ncbi:MAG: TetR/AcrR family transcriptional regulator [Planctomycetota bacterium]
MPRYSPEHKTSTRRRIVRCAARLFRAKGYAGAGVEAVMRSAGLTHGGFYAHFRSKHALFAEAVRHAVLSSGATIEAGLDDAEPAAWLIEFVTRYLSDEHRRALRDGCPLPSLLAEVDRAPKTVKTAFLEAGQQRVASLAARYAALGAAEPEAEAMATFSALAGAMAMARAMPDAEDAERAMAATRERLIARVQEFAGASGTGRR